MQPGLLGLKATNQISAQGIKRLASEQPPSDIRVETPRLFHRLTVGKCQEPTLASSSLVVTFWILNCSACMPGSARKESLPK